MRQFLHDFIDCIFDLPDDLKIFFWFKIYNPFCCYFRKPKYKIGQLTYYYKHRIASIYKDYSRNIIFYKLIDCDLSVSEELLIFYEKRNK